MCFCHNKCILGLPLESLLESSPSYRLQNHLDALAANIIKARKLLNMNQRQFADVMNVTQASIYNYEKGDRPPSLEFMVRLSDLTKIAIDELIDGTYETDVAVKAAIDRLNRDFKRKLDDLSNTL